MPPNSDRKLCVYVYSIQCLCKSNEIPTMLLCIKRLPIYKTNIFLPLKCTAPITSLLEHYLTSLQKYLEPAPFTSFESKIQGDCNEKCTTQYSRPEPIMVLDGSSRSNRLRPV